MQPVGSQQSIVQTDFIESKNNSNHGSQEEGINSPAMKPDLHMVNVDYQLQKVMNGEQE